MATTNLIKDYAHGNGRVELDDMGAVWARTWSTRDGRSMVKPVATEAAAKRYIAKQDAAAERMRKRAEQRGV